MIYIFKKAVKLEIPNESNELLIGLKALENKYDKYFDKSHQAITNDNDDYKQILWLSLSDQKDLREFETQTNKILLFSSTNQIISFLKYIFAIKPKMQFRVLDKKFLMIIHLKTNEDDRNFFKDVDENQIDILLDWLNFAGCKIPIYIYSENKLHKNVRMNIEANYWSVVFINTKREINHMILNKKEQKFDKRQSLNLRSSINSQSDVSVRLQKRSSVTENLFKNISVNKRNSLLDDAF
jgi:hypothetical protein